MQYSLPPAVVRFDSAEVSRIAKARFGHGILKADRAFQPEPSDWEAFHDLLAAEQDRELEHRWYATRFEDEAAGMLTDQDLICAGLAVG